MDGFEGGKMILTVLLANARISLNYHGKLGVLFITNFKR